MNIQSFASSPYIPNNPLKQNNYNRISFNGLREDIFERAKTDYDENVLEELGIDELMMDSKTMEELYSDKFYTPQRENEDGYYVTTIIDKKTNEPIEAYIKQNMENKVDVYPGEEEWDIYVKNGDNYDLVGYRSFTVNKHRKKILPGNMRNGERNKYKGIGLRLHQIAIERMMQENLNGIQIYSLADAFPFHYKSGFRVIPDKKYMSEKELKKEIETLSEITMIPEQTLLKCYKLKKSLFGIKKYSQSDENIKLLLYSRKKTNLDTEDMEMNLPKQEIDKWKQRINSQPILPH